MGWMSIRHNVRHDVHSSGSGQALVQWQIPVQAVPNICVAIQHRKFLHHLSDCELSYTCAMVLALTTQPVTIQKYKTVWTKTFYFSYNVPTKEKPLFTVSVCGILKVMK